MKKQIKIRAERTKAISFFLALSLLLLVGIPENVESQCCCDPICYPSWLTDAFSWVAKKTVEGAVWLYNTFLPTENEKEAYEKFKKNYNNLVEEQKEQLEFLSDEKNVRELMNSGITPEKFDDFLDYCFPSLEDLKNAASCEEKKANQRAAIDVSLAVGGMATAGVGKVVGGAAETAADIVGTSATVYGAIGPVKELLGPETFDKIIQENELGYAVRSAEALSGSYRKAYDNYINGTNKFSDDQLGKIAADFSKYFGEMPSGDAWRKTLEDRDNRRALWGKSGEVKTRLQEYESEIYDFTTMARDSLDGIKYLTGDYLPAAGAGDWDPEWEETWYWEGWDYPQTDINWEEYPYVDEHGAYDWTKG